MGIYDNWTYTDLHQLNLDWIITTIKKLSDKYDTLQETVDKLKTMVSEEVAEQIQQLLDDGTLERLINETLFNNLQNQINAVQQNIEENNVSVKATSFVDEAVCFPLWVNKFYSNGTNGTIYNPQGLTATYENGQPKTVYSFNEYGNDRHLLVMNCGERVNGTGWTYSELTNMPITHGSCLSIKDNLLYISNEAGSGTVYVYDFITATYNLLDLSHLTTTGILGCVYDEDTDTYLICCNNNNTMIVTDSSFTELRRYSHNIIYNTNLLTYQGYDFKNGYEYRTMSYQNTNCLLIYNTYTGELVKTINLLGFSGEIEDVSIYNGTAIINVVNYNVDYANIQMNAVLECYIGGVVDENMLMELQQRYTLGNNFFNLLLNRRTLRNINAYYHNNNNTTDICRYAGVGTSANPIKSGLVLSSLAIISQSAVTNNNLIFNIQTSSNIDDNAIHIEWGSDLSLYVEGNNNTINRLFVRNLHLVQLANLNVDATNAISRLTNKDVTLAFNNEIQLRTPATFRNMEIVDTSLLIAYNTITVTGTGSISRGCATTTTTGRFTNTTVSDMVQ